MEAFQNRKLLGISCVTQLFFSCSFIVIQHLLGHGFCIDNHECIRKSVKIFLINIYISVLLGWLATGGAIIHGNNRICTDVKSKIFCFLRALFMTFCGNFVYHFIAIIYGAPVIQEFEETHLFSCIMSAMTFLPLTIFSDGKWWTLIQILEFKLYKSGQMVDNVRLMCFMTIVGALASSAVIPLDWDRPWQAWPVPCVTGAAIGYGASLLLFATLSFFEYLKTRFEKSKVKFY